MRIRISQVFILAILLLGLLFLAFLPIFSGDRWSVANAQTVPPTPTLPLVCGNDPRCPRDVPEADTLLLVGGGLGGLTTWLGWQLNRARTKKK